MYAKICVLNPMCPFGSLLGSDYALAPPRTAPLFFHWVILSKKTELCLLKRGEPPLAPPCPSWLFLCNCRRATLSWPGQSLGTFLSLLHKHVSLLVISFDSSQTGEHGSLSIGPGTWCRRTCVAISASASLSAPFTSYSYGLPLTAT